MPRSVIRDAVDRDPVTRRIVAIDGEGWNIPLTPGQHSSNPHVKTRGWHSYIMLDAADDNGWHKSLIHDGSRREREPNRARNYGLRTKDICDFLLDDLPYDALVVSFVFSYDTTKIFADLPFANLCELSNEKPVTQEEYETRLIRIAAQHGLNPQYMHRLGVVSEASTVWNGLWIKYVPRKVLEITDLRAGKIPVLDRFIDKRTGEPRIASKPENKWSRKITVWDVYGFFQASFVKALSNYRCGLCDACRAKPQEHCLTAMWTADDLARIATMKAGRGEFNAARIREIERYCIDECRYLSFLTRDLLVHVKNFGLSLTKFHGSGALADAWMRQNKIKEYLPVKEETSEPEEYDFSGLPGEVCLSAYFGGRFEITEITGPMPVLHNYDINSAYPHIARSLPCLAHGRFRRVTEYQPGMIGVYLAGSRTAGYKYAPFPFRTKDKPEPGMVKDAIYYCHGGQRWIWQDELAAARKHYGTDAIPVYDGYVWEPECADNGCDGKPFAQIPELYSLRQQYVSEGNGVEKVIKLILNSLYGKTAQSQGSHPFQCYIWAGMITSGCRAMIIDAVMQPDADVVSIATDGILSRTVITALPCPDEKILGAWEHKTVYDGYLFQSGVYTMLAACKDGESCTRHKPDEHERASNGLTATRIYKTRGFGPREVPARALIDAFNAGQVTVNASPDESRFIPMKSGRLRTEALEYIGQWIPSVHDVSFNHNRRLPAYEIDDDGPVLSGIIRLSDAPILPDDVMSAPYPGHESWESVLEHQPPAADMDYMEITGWAEAGLADAAGSGITESAAGLASEPDTGPADEQGPAGLAIPDL